MFRSVALPREVPGRLYLHSMPGKNEPFTSSKQAIANASVGRVVCLTPPQEVESKSPEYAAAIAAGVPWNQTSHPIPDFGVPEDGDAFRKLVNEVAGEIRAGKNVLAHCAAGIGRTGTFAVAVLLALGLPLEKARAAVRAAGSSAESQDQIAFLETL